MEHKNTTLIVCEALAPEVENIVHPNVEVKVIEFGLHNYPQKLNIKLHDVLQKLESEKKQDLILLGYGLCSDGVVGLKSDHAQIVIPKTFDCIAVFLGSRDVYKEQLKREPGTYYLTKGWIEYGQTPLSILRRQHEWTKKYDEKTIRRVAREMIKNYRRVAFIKTGAYEPESYIAYSREVAAAFGLEFEVVPGAVGLLKKLLDGHWDDNFLVVDPGQEITKSMFFQDD